MILKITKGTRKNIVSYGKYTAKAMHLNTITMDDVCKEIESNCSAKSSDVELVLRELVDVLKHHLQEGHRVQLPHLGTMKMDIESKAFDNPKDFNPAEHIKRCKISFIAKSYKGRQTLLDDIKIDKVITDQ
ncbi:MAG: HU family DNA-binding protein [Prevotella sp.]|nr:HU family DNA-binding protein [Prevotella sp.]